MRLRLLFIVCWVQGIYYLITGIWPLVHLPSFLAVTGPKTDLWLVRTAGVIVTAIGASLACAAYRKLIESPTIVLATLGALGLMAIDVIYVWLDVIAKIYLVDAAAQLGLVVGWVVGLGLSQSARRTLG
jgi:hypothetical protein